MNSAAKTVALSVVATVIAWSVIEWLKGNNHAD